MQSYMDVISKFFTNQMSIKDFENYIMSQLFFYEDGTIQVFGEGLEEADSDNSFTITRQHVLRLCNCILEFDMNPLVLISFGMNIVTWDKEFPLKVETPEDSRACRVIYDWYAYAYHDIELNKENVLAWKNFLLTGVYYVVWKSREYLN